MSELEEAAEIAGGSWLATMRDVVLPLLMPTVLVAVHRDPTVR